MLESYLSHHEIRAFSFLSAFRHKKGIRCSMHLDCQALTYLRGLRQQRRQRLPHPASSRIRYQLKRYQNS